MTERVVPYFCPYCADEDLRPHGEAPGTWLCRACTRTFRVSFLGLADPRPTPPPTGGPR